MSIPFQKLPSLAPVGNFIEIKLIREGFGKKNNYLHGIFHGEGGGGYPPSVQIINFLKNKIRPLQTVLNGLKHEKKSIKKFTTL